MATSWPLSASRPASTSPAGPAPITITSNVLPPMAFSLLMASPSAPLCRAVVSRRQFGRQHVDGLNVGGRRKQLIRPLHQRSGDRAVQMSLAPRCIGKNVNNPQSRGPDLDGEPGGRLGLGLRKRQGAGKKRGELVFLAWFSLQCDQQSDRDHGYLLSSAGIRPQDGQVYAARAGWPTNVMRNRNCRRTFLFRRRGRGARPPAAQAQWSYAAVALFLRHGRAGRRGGVAALIHPPLLASVAARVLRLAGPQMMTS